MEDRAAISLLKQGDLRGMEILVKRYQLQAIHAGQLILRDRDLAEEVVQSAFLRLPEIIRTFDDDRSFKPWFMQIVVNDALKAIRQDNRWVELPEEADEDAARMAGWLIDVADPPEIQIITAETRQTVRKALQLLTPEQRSVIVMRYFLEMSGDEMASKMDRPLSTIKWWLHSAKQRLHEILQ